MPEATNKMIEVNAGDFIVWRNDTGGGMVTGRREKGGWFLAKSDEKLGHNAPLLGRAKQPFNYRESEGARYHSIQFETVKRFMAIERKTQVITPDYLRRQHQNHLDIGPVAETYTSPDGERLLEKVG